MGQWRKNLNARQRKNSRKPKNLAEHDKDIATLSKVLEESQKAAAAKR